MNIVEKHFIKWRLVCEKVWSNACLTNFLIAHSLNGLKKLHFVWITYWTILEPFSHTMQNTQIQQIHTYIINIITIDSQNVNCCIPLQC